MKISINSDPTISGKLYWKLLYSQKNLIPIIKFQYDFTESLVHIYLSII